MTDFDRRGWNQAVCTGIDPGQNGMGSSGCRHFSQDYCPPRPILHPIALQWSEQAERALMQQKQKENWEVFSDGTFNLKHVND